MISTTLLQAIRCPGCRGGLSEDGDRFCCGSCGRTYPQRSADVLDLRPTEAFSETTKYVDEALHQDARHESVSPPVLSASIRQDMLRSFLDPGPDDLVADLGCGSGRMMLWNRPSGAHLVGVDVSPFFAHEAREHFDLVLADLRRLPLADGAFTKAYSLDVLEHLSPDALDGMLAEASRILVPGGALFVYSHVRKNAPIAQGLRWINRLAARLDRWGLIDLRQEHLRKSDHVNPLTDIPHLEQVVHRAGLRIARIRYYTPLIGGFMENIVLRMAERWLTGRFKRSIEPKTRNGAGTHPNGGEDQERDREALRRARTAAKARVAARGPLYLALRGVTWLMKLDVMLFGRIRSGPFFALLVKECETSSKFKV